LSYIKLREQFGKKIGEFQITRHKIAEMATQIELASLITHKAAQTIDNGKPDYAICAMAKNSATRSAVKVTDEAIQLFGGYGYTTEYEVERFYRDAKVLELMGSSKSYLKDKIAEKEIGRIKKSKK
ncbi:MAG: acyl-CoA dehydrogenase, partial [bacterium]|nr:acyl-CoA dehydrogenase [bacterium]